MIATKRHSAVLLGMSLLALYILTFKGTAHSTDEWLFIDQLGKTLSYGFQRPEKFYISYYALLLPFFSLSKIIPSIGSYQVLTTWNMISTSISGVAILLILDELGYGFPTSILAGLTYGAATQAWPYSNYLLREPTGAMWVTLSALFSIRFEKSRRWQDALASSIMIVLAAITKRSLSVLLPIILLYLTTITYKIKTNSVEFMGKDQGLRALLSTLTIAIAAILMYSFRKYYYFPMPGHISEILPNLKVMLAMFLSPGWGLLLFSPVLLLALLGTYGFLKKNLLRGSLLLSMPWLYFIGMSHHPLWWGTWNWGPRQVNPVLPLFILPIAESYEIARKKTWLKALTAILFLVSAILSGMQALVSYPFYQEAFKKGFTSKDFMWRWKTSPVLNHWRFITLSNIETAWGYGGRIKWGLLLFELAILGYMIWLLWRTLHRRPVEKVLIEVGAVALVLATAWNLVSVYRSPAYGGNVGFPEAASILRKEWHSSDDLVIYMWGDPPLAYIPKIAMLNYCKGDCCNQISVIKEQFIDGRKSWTKRLFGYLSSSQRTWIIEQKVRENAPERPVEFALAQKMYFVKAMWTGAEVRLLLFDKGKNSRKISESNTTINYPHERLTAFSVYRDRKNLYVDLKFYAKDDAAWHHKISLQVLDSSWKLRAQKDMFLNAFVPPQVQKAGNNFTIKVAKYLPEDIPSGKYKLILVVYDPVSGTRFSQQDGKDFLQLSEISIP